MKHQGLARLAALAALALAACSPSITFITSQRTPEAEPLHMRGAKVAAVVMMQDQAIRKQAEDALARAITKRGAVGVPMYTLLPSSSPLDEAAAHAALDKAGMKGVVVMRPRRAQKKVVTPPETYMAPMYMGYWGGYYPYGWGAAYDASWVGPMSAYGKPQGPEHGGAYNPGYYAVSPAVTVPGHTEVYDVIRVEILVYSLKQNRLAWFGEAETSERGDVDAFVKDLAEATAKELAEVRLIWN